jgi:hypothetical protein
MLHDTLTKCCEPIFRSKFEFCSKFFIFNMWAGVCLCIGCSLNFWRYGLADSLPLPSVGMVSNLRLEGLFVGGTPALYGTDLCRFAQGHLHLPTS